MSANAIFVPTPAHTLMYACTDTSTHIHTRTCVYTHYARTYTHPHLHTHTGTHMCQHTYHGSFHSCRSSCSHTCSVVVRPQLAIHIDLVLKARILCCPCTVPKFGRGVSRRSHTARFVITFAHAQFFGKPLLFACAGVRCAHPVRHCRGGQCRHHSPAGGSHHPRTSDHGGSGRGGGGCGTADATEGPCAIRIAHNLSNIRATTVVPC